MRLTLYADYSLRVLIHAGLKQDGRATIGEISECYGISRNHLMKVVNQLGRLGYLKNMRGRNGGFRLAMPPAAINIGEVVRRVEGDMALVQCFDPAAPKCRIEPACVLRSVLGEALAAFLAVLDDCTLADLIAPGPTLDRLLNTGPGQGVPASEANP